MSFTKGSDWESPTAESELEKVRKRYSVVSFAQRIRKMENQAETTISPAPQTPLKKGSSLSSAGGDRSSDWPVDHDRQRVRWFPASHRLISLVRGNRDSYVLPPAVVRKASWRD